MGDLVAASLIAEDDEFARETILKTAKYVAENGASFEKKLRDDPRFSFVNPGNSHYELYERMLVDEQRSGTKNNEAFLQDKDTKPQEPYPFSFMSYAKKLTKRDLEIIKLSAAYCVVNEDIDYMEKMRNQFKEDELFGFLSPDHALNSTFIHFMNQYRKVKSGELGPPFFELRNEDFKYKILHRSFERAEFNEYSKELKNEKQRAMHMQKVQFAAFDWTQFKVVDKFTPLSSDDTDVPKPLDFNQLAVKRLGSAGGLDIFDKVHEQQQTSSKESEGKSRKRKVKAAGETRLKRRNIGSSMRNTSDIKYIECPISHKMVPEDKFDKHLQILLTDPHYKLEREKYEAKHKLSNLSSTEVFENVKRIARIASEKT